MTLERLKEEEIKTIAASIDRGESLKTISKKLSKSKTTVYYHFRKIKGRTVYPVKIRSTDPELIGEFVGLFAGDGNYHFDKKSNNYNIRLYFNLNENVFVDSLINNVLINLFGKKPNVYTKGNMITLRYHSKAIYLLIKTYLTWNPKDKKTYTVRLIKTDHTKDFMVGFIRGSLDSDGYFSKDKISFASVSKGLIYNISEFLDNFDIIHRLHLYKEKRENRKDIYHLDVPKFEREKFLPLIKPRKVKF